MGFKRNYEESDEERFSKINAAGLINATLETLWSETYTSMANGDYLKWNVKLDSIWAILGGDEKVGGKAEQELNEINKKIYSQGNLSSSIGKGFEKKANPNNASQYYHLLQKSLFLRRLQNKQGKGTAYDSGDEDDFE